MHAAVNVTYFLYDQPDENYISPKHVAGSLWEKNC
jgi:hypothetical protein